MLKMTYSSPRWSAEILDCSMPMSMDTYSRCAYNCLYCFSYFQKSHVVNGYLTGDVRSVDPQKVISLFENARSGGKIKTNYAQFVPYIRDRKIMQWGGLADQFDEYERRNGITLELLKYFDRIDYPISFSTKATWWTEDDRYMSLFARHTHNWHTKISIITDDDGVSKRMEKGVSPSSERIRAIGRLTAQGNRVTLRLRPYIVGVSEGYESLIARAANAGADCVTTEFFCMESRANAGLKARYAEMSKICGFDIHDFYIKNSHQHGYKRLSRKVKLPIAERMKAAADKAGIRFVSSDAHLRDFNDACNCCGVPPEWGNFCTGHVGQAVLIARKNGLVRYADIAEQQEKYFSFPWDHAAGFNTGGSHFRCVYYDTSMAQWLRYKWNDLKGGSGVFHGYGDILKPSGTDKDGNVVFAYCGRGNSSK